MFGDYKTEETEHTIAYFNKEFLCDKVANEIGTISWTSTAKDYSDRIDAELVLSDCSHNIYLDFSCRKEEYQKRVDKAYRIIDNIKAMLESMKMSIEVDTPHLRALKAERDEKEIKLIVDASEKEEDV